MSRNEQLKSVYKDSIWRVEYNTYISSSKKYHFKLSFLTFQKY